MSYFKLRPLIKRYKEQMRKKYGIEVYKVKWSKEQLDLMMKVVEQEQNGGLVRQFKNCHIYKFDNINILDK